MSYLVSSQCVYLRCPGVAKSVLMQLADIANDHGIAWPSIEHLCMRTDWSRRAVIDALDWLEKQGAIVREKRSGRHTSYRITPSNFQGERHPVPDQPGLSNPCTTRTGAVGAPVQQAHPTRAPAARDPCAKRTLITKNHHEPSIPPNPPSGGAPGFDEFWAGYPRQVDREGARRAWDKLAPSAELQADMARAVKVWARSDEWAKDGGRYVPKAGNWLGNRRWLDVPGLAVVATAPAAPLLPPPPELTADQLRANGERARQAAARARQVMLGRAAA